MQQRQTNLIKLFNILVDYILLNLSLFFVYSYFHNTFLYGVGEKTCVNIVLIFNLIWMLSANIVNLYHITSLYEIYKKALKAFVVYVVLISYLILYLNIESYNINNRYVVIWMCLFAVHLSLWKIVAVKTIQYLNISRPSLRRAVIIGGGRSAIALYKRFKTNWDMGYEVLGIFNDKPLRDSFKKLHLGDTSGCIDFSLQNDVNEIFCALPFSEKNTIERLITESDKNMIRFKLVPEHYEYFQGSLLAQSLDNIDAYAIRAEPLENIMNRVVKRLFDIFFSLFVIIFILSWLYPILYILIKLESEGPAIFVQLRSGRNNTPFNCYKFRSMAVNKDSHLVQATKGDARVTKIGAFLRKTSLDEMPQFFNVLIGNMSVVGPRPHMLKHTEQYSKLIDQFMVRHFIKPGITGWAQIQGFRGETRFVEDMKDRVAADVWYMENWSFTLDMKIIIATFFRTIIGDKHAY